ncbi:hypothetical protein MMC21_008505 [Puttea exsequens]|nr:hypothetical protein [Puttea exsequens]
MAFAQPVTRGNFLYNGDLYVDVGNLNRHKRVSLAEITEVLRPDLKKSKSGPPLKDPVGHWYEAQLIHYGLPPSKDKARAKMRLLENLNNSNLKVPPGIIAIESDLKKEFAAAERKAKAQHKASVAANNLGKKKPKADAKRKLPESGTLAPNIHVNINIGSTPPSGLGSFTSQIDSPPAKRTKQIARRGGGPSSGLLRAGVQSRSVTDQSTPSIHSHEDQAPRKYSTKQTARRSIGSFGIGSRDSDSVFDISKLTAATNKKAVAKKETNAKSDAKTSKVKVKQEPILKKELSKEPNTKKEPKIKKRPAVKNESAVNKEPAAKKEPKVKKELNVTHRPVTTLTSSYSSLGLINGVYDITCPKLEGEWNNCRDLTLILTLDSTSLWGAYDFGVFAGIIRFAERPWSPSDEGLHFQWRGRETGEGEMSFGDDCHGEMAFVGGGGIAGIVNLYGDCPFQGVRRNGPGTPVRSAVSMRNEWDGYSNEAYEHERRARWSG